MCRYSVHDSRHLPVDPMRMRLYFLILFSFPLLAGCDFLYDVLDVPQPEQRAAVLEAEGRAVGGGCRHSGRALEDCYALNQGVSKSAIFDGWRAMNDYMREHGIDEVPVQRATRPDSGRLTAIESVEPGT